MKPEIRLTILYDNNLSDTRLRTDWGFSCLIEGFEETILFDTGADANILAANASALATQDGEAESGNKLAGIDLVVLSHAHQDHTGGLRAVLEANPGIPVYLPASFSASAKREIARLGGQVFEVTAATQIRPGIHSTGELEATPSEQGLILETPQGTILLSGCAHPGIVRMVSQTIALVPGEPLLIMGGLHLGGMSRVATDEIVTTLQELGVRHIAPTHCSGDPARQAFRAAYGDDYLEVGAGYTLRVSDLE